MALQPRQRRRRQVYDYVLANHPVTRSDVRNGLCIGDDNAGKLLQQVSKAGLIAAVGFGRGAKWVPAPKTSAPSKAMRRAVVSVFDLGAAL